jgi:hypothetical protein
MKLLAVNEGRKLKDVAADLLERGLNSGTKKSNTKISKDFLLIAPNSAPEMTPDQVRRILEETP